MPKIWVRRIDMPEDAAIGVDSTGLDDVSDLLVRCAQVICVGSCVASELCLSVASDSSLAHAIPNRTDISALAALGSNDGSGKAFILSAREGSVLRFNEALSHSNNVNNNASRGAKSVRVVRGSSPATASATIGAPATKHVPLTNRLARTAATTTTRAAVNSSGSQTTTPQRRAMQQLSASPPFSNVAFGCGRSTPTPQQQRAASENKKQEAHSRSATPTAAAAAVKSGPGLPPLKDGTSPVSVAAVSPASRSGSTNNTKKAASSAVIASPRALTKTTRRVSPSPVVVFAQDASASASSAPRTAATSPSLIRDGRWNDSTQTQEQPSHQQQQQQKQKTQQLNPIAVRKVTPQKRSQSSEQALQLRSSSSSSQKSAEKLDASNNDNNNNNDSLNESIVLHQQRVAAAAKEQEEEILARHSVGVPPHQVPQVRSAALHKKRTEERALHDSTHQRCSLRSNTPPFSRSASSSSPAPAAALLNASGSARRTASSSSQNGSHLAPRAEMSNNYQCDDPLEDKRAAAHSCNSRSRLTCSRKHHQQHHDPGENKNRELDNSAAAAAAAASVNKKKRSNRFEDPAAGAKLSISSRSLESATASAPAPLVSSRAANLARPQPRQHPADPPPAASTKQKSDVDCMSSSAAAAAAAPPVVHRTWHLVVCDNFTSSWGAPRVCNNCKFQRRDHVAFKKKRTALTAATAGLLRSNGHVSSASPFAAPVTPTPLHHHQVQSPPSASLQRSRTGTNTSPGGGNTMSSIGPGSKSDTNNRRSASAQNDASSAGRAVLNNAARVSAALKDYSRLSSSKEDDGDVGEEEDEEEEKRKSSSAPIAMTARSSVGGDSSDVSVTSPRRYPVDAGEEEDEVPQVPPAAAAAACVAVETAAAAEGDAKRVSSLADADAAENAHFAEF